MWQSVIHHHGCVQCKPRPTRSIPSRSDFRRQQSTCWAHPDLGPILREVLREELLADLCDRVQVSMTDGVDGHQTHEHPADIRGHHVGTEKAVLCHQIGMQTGARHGQKQDGSFPSGQLSNCSTQASHTICLHEVADGTHVDAGLLQIVG